MKYKIVNQQTEPHYQSGMVWLTKRRVLLRVGDKIMWHRPGVTKSLGMSSYDKTYYPMEICYNSLAVDPHSFYGTIHDNFRNSGRLGKKLFKQYDERIKEIFGIDFNFSEAYAPGKTVVVEGIK